MDRKNDGIGIIMRYYLRYALWILLAFGFLVCEALCELELPSYMSKIITDGIMAVNMKQVLGCVRVLDNSQLPCLARRLYAVERYSQRFVRQGNFLLVCGV